MQIKVRNLGIIKQADISLDKKLTFFCGSNGTGKTYLSYLIYAILADRRMFFPENLHKEVKINGNTMTFRLKPEFIMDYITWCEESFKNQLPECFGISEEDAQRLFGDFSLSLTSSDYMYERFCKDSISETIEIEAGVDTTIVTKEPDSDTINVTIAQTESPLSSTDSDTILPRKFYAIIMTLISQIAKGGATNARMLTVERNSIYTFKTELSLNRMNLVEQLIKSSNPQELIRQNSRRYSAPINKSLQTAIDLTNVSKFKTPFGELADMLQKDILRGQVAISDNGDVTFSQTELNVSEIPIQISASAVKTLSSLVIYLRHIADDGDMLIIDEPEMNLFPENQRILARLLVKMANAGIRLIISTHSDYIIREINNLIIADSLKKNGLETAVVRNGYSSSDSIPREEVGVYVFNFGNDGRVVSENIPVKDFGFDIQAIDDTINRQNEATEDLYNALLNLKK